MQDLRMEAEIVGSMNNDGHYRIREEDVIRSKGLMELEEEAGEKRDASPLFARKNSMRNKACPCKSGKKFKKCCWNKFNEVSL